MNRIKNLTFKILVLTVGITLTFFSCEDEIANEKTTEDNIIEYGISQNDFENSNAFNGILSRLNSNNGLSNRTDETANQLTSQELLQRLDLSKGYIHQHDDGKELLSVPVRTQGDYKRVLLSLTKDNFTNSFLLTYPDSTNNKLYYVSSLDGLLLQKVTIQDNGIGITQTFNTQEHNHGTASRSSTGGCTETVYTACSSGNHSFAWGNAMECTFWTNLGGGTPPTVATIDVGCSGGGGTSGGSSGGSSGGGTSGGGTNTGGGGFNGGDGDGFSGVPIVKGGNSLVDADDCVANLDCDECNLGPHDIDGDCNLTAVEITINSINNCLGGALTGVQKNTLMSNPKVAFDAYSAIGISCSNPDSLNFLISILDQIDHNDIVDFELEIVLEINETVEFQNQTCLKSIKDDVVSTGEMTKIIKKFEPTYPVLHLEWGMFSNTQWGNTGNTSLNAEQDTAFINLNSESLSHVNNIVMVKTIAHELIHAELLRKLKELVDDYNIISLSEYNALQDNFMGIADYTFRYGELTVETNAFGQVTVWGLDPDLSLAHHNQMAAFYRQTLIDVMKAYDTANGITRTNADEFYEALSWAGLRQTSDENGENSQYTDAWKNFKNQIDIDEANLPESERTYNRYLNIINQEYNGSGINCN